MIDYVVKNVIRAIMSRSQTPLKEIYIDSEVDPWESLFL